MIKKLVNDYKEQSRLKREEELMSEFDVAERGGRLWFTHCGVAFLQVKSDINADNIASMLKEARDTAVEFEKL